MTHDTLTYDDLLRIVELIKSSEQFSEFRLKIGEIEIELRRRDPSGAAAAAAPNPVAADASPVARSPTAEAPAIGAAAPPVTPSAVAPDARSAEHAAVPSAAAAPTWEPGSVVVRAPMVGTFYRAPAPGAPPFVQVGQAVEPDTTVCIIEVMKLMNSIPAGARGVVMQVLVDDGAPVESDAPLVVVDPRSSAR